MDLRHFKRTIRNSSLILKRSKNYFHRFLGTDLWKQKVDIKLYQETEDYWKKEFAKSSYFDGSKLPEKFYVLSMFPYPSGNLHMGHVRVYTISDALAHYHRMSGKNVFQPMGWDAFGLPAENAAFQRRIAPDVWIRQNIDQMKNQLKDLSITFDWNYELNTSDPKYYRWTQHIFLKMYEAGLVYRKEALVNWDPVDETVLADEQVDEHGNSWRSGAKVTKRVLKQWFIRTTKFAESLQNGLNDANSETWKDISVVQKNWIGECNGYSFDFKIHSSDDTFVNIWVEDPLSILKAEFVVIKPNSLIDILYGENCGVERKLDIMAVNPFTNHLLPIYVSSEVNFPYERDTYLGVPSVLDADKEFASGVNLPLCKFESFSLTAQQIRQQAEKLNIGGYRVSSKLTDWLISRQRFWGTPIPMIHCTNCGIQPVPYDELPVTLPSIPKNHRVDKHIHKILMDSDWKRTSCPKCGGNAFRETDTMDTFVDSSWYYLRYIDCDNDHKPFDSDIVNRILPVDIYVGGKEHAKLHLYYARFVSHFLHSIGLISVREPFSSFLCQGKVRSKTYKNSKGHYFKTDEVKLQDNKAFSKDTNEELTCTWEKMSKSKFNGIEPNSILNEYGIDTTRLFLTFDHNPTESIDWNPKVFTAVLGWQYRIWLTVKDFLRVRSNPLKGPQPVINMKEEESILRNARNLNVGEITYNYEKTQDLAWIVYRLQYLTTLLRAPAREVRKYSEEYEKCLAVFLIMLAPLAPHFTSTLWLGFTSAPDRINNNLVDWSKNVLKQRWPTVDCDVILPVCCQINDNKPFKIGQVVNKHLSELTLDEALNDASKHKGFQNVSKRMKLNLVGLIKNQGFNAVIRFRGNKLNEKI